MLRVRKQDLTTFLVQSRTRDDVEHLVDALEGTCSCEAMLDFATATPENPCAHVEAVIMFLAGAKPHRPRRSSPFAILNAPHED